ncbi:hypothetical protein A9179_16665 [Pseudomonas alcaligenes]|uniref:Uncharacterized protein n=1 Tax=Aquipseudomonas alcaligenes TaxID=43263 RepID=A0ABR7S2W7_AQUAC|nr:hypothetical protein [Pseudomonas alcaligenes]MBC9251905.1 hypothetical protein [Pseudomonas alcaligenes]
MLHAQLQDQLYCITHDEEQRALIDAFAVNVQDRQWLIYCALGGHEHPEYPDSDPHTGVSLPELYQQAA